MKQGTGKKKAPESYRERDYRRIRDEDLISSPVKVVETDLHILASRPVEDEALSLVVNARNIIEEYIKTRPDFLQSLQPLPPDESARPLIREMLTAGRAAGVGPMATVAGTISEVVGKGLLAAGVEEVIVENGGDIFMFRKRESTIAVFAGQSPLSGKVGIRIAADKMPLGICCSSASVGHSLSLGAADAVVVLAESTPLADAAATRLGNEVEPGPKGINQALEVAKTIEGIAGVLVIAGQHLGAWGEVELTKI